MKTVYTRRMSEKKDIEFIHLHTHTHFSLLDGLSKVDKVVARAKELGMSAIAMTDHGAMYGAIEFYKACKAAGIKPIIGVEAYIANRTRLDKESGIDNKRFHLTLLAKNETGYRNLVRLTTAAHIEGYYYKPRMDKDILRMYSSGVIALSGCPAGELGRAILRSNDLERSEAIIREHQEIFGKENYFIEIMHHPDVEDFERWRSTLIMLSKKLDVPLVATQDSHYIHPDDARAHKTLIAISTNTDVNDTGIFSGNGDYHFITTEEAMENFRDIHEAVFNTKKVADMCDIKLELGSWVFPHLDFARGNADDELRHIAEEGIVTHEMKDDSVLRERFEYELKVIKDKGYSPYFLVVADLLRHAREVGIYTTVRGSAAGSLITYLTGITNVDPIEFQLPFERFLNPF